MPNKKHSSGIDWLKREETGHKSGYNWQYILPKSNLINEKIIANRTSVLRQLQFCNTKNRMYSVTHFVIHIIAKLLVQL